MKVKIGDWISWYNFQDGIFEIGEVQREDKRKYWPHKEFYYTTNGAVELEDIIETRAKK